MTYDAFLAVLIFAEAKFTVNENRYFVFLRAARIEENCRAGVKAAAVSQFK
jgi:hypothetical protein